MDCIDMNDYREQMVDTLRRYVRIDTTATRPEPNRPYGRGVFDGLMFLHSLSDRLGMDCVNLFGHMVYMEYGEGDETLAILTHADVVPAGDGWTHDPFGGDIENGRIYGRGTVDDKGPGVAALYALKAVMDSGVHLNKKVRLIFGGDEERGMSDIEYYLAHEKEPEYLFSPDAEFPIINCEKGIYHCALTAKQKTDGLTALSSGSRVNVVPHLAFATMKGEKIEVSGMSAHASTPDKGENAAGKLMIELSKRTDDPAVAALASRIGKEYHGQSAGLDWSDPVSGRLTLNLGLLSLTEEGKIVAGIDIRYPIDKSGDEVKAALLSAFGEEFEMTYEQDSAPHYVPEDAPIIAKLSEAYEEVTGKEARCVAIGGGTYARHFANGVAFGPEHPDKSYSIHGPEESYEIDDMVELSKMIYAAIIKICG